MESELTIAYWHIRGLAAPLRMMCEYSGVPFKNVTYPVPGEAGSWDLSAWFDAKPALKAKNGLMNLPYIIDGELVITQSLACYQYLARKLNLYGEGIVENAKVDQISCEVMDLRNAAVGVFYGSGDFQKHFEKTVPTHYGKLDLWFEQQGTLYTIGEKPTAGDFHLWEMLDQHELCASDKGFSSPLANFPRLRALYDAFRKEPTLESYFLSEMYKLSVNNKMAQWGA